MFGFSNLKREVQADALTAPCPVEGCEVRLPRQTHSFRRAEQFRCPIHRIYVGASTFEYEDARENLLLSDTSSLHVLQRITAFKRESRMARERSEDAVTWNVFRHLQSSRRLADWASFVCSASISAPTAHFWSYDGSSDAVWNPLAEARRAFGELSGRESEPDLIIEGRDVDVWIEAKVGASNDTKPSDIEGSRQRYTEGGHGWYWKSVKSSFDTVAVELKRYELMRLWLLGSWAAQQRGKRFVLVNLVRAGRESEVVKFAESHFFQTQDRYFRRATWEAICGWLEGLSDRGQDDNELISYMREKTMGYRDGRLLRAFACCPGETEIESQQMQLRSARE